MSRLTRRNALTAVAALPALAVPSVAIAAAGPPDPIFAAIENFHCAATAFGKALDRQGDLESLPDKVTRTPRVVVGEERELHTSVKTLKDGTWVCRSKRGKKTGKFYYATDLAEIERNAPKGPEREGWIAERVAMLEADASAVKLRQDECGWTAAKLAVEETGEAERIACEAMVETRPTSKAGLLALLSCVVAEHERGNLILDEDMFETLTKTTLAALSSKQPA
jgi:hypothetical protein